MYKSLIVLCILGLALSGCAWFSSDAKELEQLQAKDRVQRACNAVCQPFQTYVCWPTEAICLTATHNILKRVEVK